jgi:hypothetical protein
MARNPIAKLVMAFFFILDVFAVVFLFIDLVKTTVITILSLVFLRPLSSVFFLEALAVFILLFFAIKVGEWLWQEIEE